MISEKLRRQICYEAAQLLASRRETDLHRARFRAVRKLCRGWVRNADLPTLPEIQHELQRFETAVPADVSEPQDLAEDHERFQLYRSLLLPLEQVKQHRERHPEGDALYHSLQVYVLAREALPYDEEFQLAALLHDVGKGIDRHDHVEAGLRALHGSITDRTEWLIAHHADAQRRFEGTIGNRARRRLARDENGEELMLLATCDRDGRVPGAEVPELDEALRDIQELSGLFG